MFSDAVRLTADVTKTPINIDVLTYFVFNIIPVYATYQGTTCRFGVLVK